MSRRFFAPVFLAVLSSVSLADEAATKAAAAPATGKDGLPEYSVPLPQDKLPTAKDPGFFDRHPLSMPTFKMPKVDTAKYKPTAGYVGFGLFNDMLNIHGDIPTPAGHFYLRAGRFMDTNAFSSVNGGWRTPITGTVDTNGYSAGIFGGQIIADSFARHPYNRMGIGADMSYQWINAHTMKVATVGLGFGEPRKENGETKLAKPVMFFSYTIDLKVF